MDDLLYTIKFPFDFQRRIPSLENLKNFKASEFKNLLLYGLVPAFGAFIIGNNVSESEMIDFFHWIAIYNEIAFRLNANQVDMNSLPVVDRLVTIWQKLIPYYLGEENQTYNCHATRHLVHFVKTLGPLQNYSTFSFESFNSVYAKMVTSAHGTLNQVARRFIEEKYIKSCQYPEEEGFRNRTVGSVILLTQPEIVTLSEEESDILETAFGEVVTEILCINSAKVGSITIRTQVFEKEKATCTYVAKFSEQESSFFGVIFRIFIYSDRVFALCKEIHVLGTLIEKVGLCTNPQLRSFWEAESIEYPPYGNGFSIVNVSDTYRVVQLGSIVNRCILASFNDFLVLMDECMDFEHN